MFFLTSIFGLRSKKKKFIETKVAAINCRVLTINFIIKTHTSKKIQELITENPQESRKEWLLWFMERAGLKNSNVKNRQFWQQNNKPIELWSNEVIQQKLDYIHNNPVESGFVKEPHHWKYSSASNFAGDNTIIELDVF